jgi:hypothetical protein
VTAQLPSGFAFSMVNCQLDGPEGILLQEPISVAGSSVDFALQNVPASSGLSISLTTTSTDGSEECKAQTSFAVLPNQETATALLFSCEAAGADP